ncbi:hypothetical protein, partial [Bacteroides cellulosilyticus]
PVISILGGARFALHAFLMRQDVSVLFLESLSPAYFTFPYGSFPYGISLRKYRAGSFALPCAFS